MDSLALTPAALAETLSLIDEGVISGKIAKDVLPRLLEGEGNSGVRAFVEAQGLVQISGEGRVLIQWVSQPCCCAQTACCRSCEALPAAAGTVPAEECG